MRKSAVILLTCFLCLCAALGAAEAAESLKPGDSGDAVLELNTRLRQLNYSSTRASVRRFFTSSLRRSA